MTRWLVLLATGAPAFAYVLGWVRLARRAARPPSGLRLAAGLGGLAVVVLALGSPLDAAAHARFSAHMLQHVLLTMVAAPVLLLADPFPALLWSLPAGARRALGPELARGGRLRAVAAALVAPPVAWLLHALTLWGWHWPPLYDAALADARLHALQHVTLFATALAFWWPVVGPAPRVRRPAGPAARIAYLVLGAFQTAALGLLLTLSPWALYPGYAGAPDALGDQARGGIVMWGAGGLVDMAAVMALVWRLLAREEGPAIDPPRPVRQNEAV